MKAKKRKSQSARQWATFMAMMLRAASVFAVSSNLDMMRSRPQRRLAFPFLLLPGCILIGLACLRLLFLMRLSRWWIIAAVIIFLFFLGAFSSTDVLIDLCQFLKGETLTEMYHHGGIEQRLVPEFLQTEKVLNVRILGNRRDGLFIRQMLLLFHIDRTIRDPRRKGCASDFLIHTPQIHLFNVAPWHDLGSLYPTVILFQLSSEWKKKLIYTKLIGIVFVVHKAPHIPGFCCYTACFACLYYTTFLLLLVYFTSISDPLLHFLPIASHYSRIFQ